jgi:hypothetical protein
VAQASVGFWVEVLRGAWAEAGSQPSGTNSRQLTGHHAEATCALTPKPLNPKCVHSGLRFHWTKVTKQY